MVADLSRVDQWIRATLSGDAFLTTAVAGRIYADEAPMGATSPMIVFAFLGGADRLLTLSARLTSALYLIRAITTGSSYDPIEGIADRIDDILKVPPSGIITRDVRISSCAREQPHQRKDASEGVPVVYLGGYYRVGFQPALQ